MALLVLMPQGLRAETRLSLADAIATARRHRSEVAAAELEVQLARIGLLRAGMQRARLTVEGRAAEQIERLYVGAGPELCESIEGLCQPAARSRIIDLSANLEVPIFAGFGVQAAWSRARSLERAAGANRRAQLRGLGLEVATAYWTVRWTELQKDAAERALERRRAMTALIKARAEAGIAPAADRNRAEIAVLGQEAEVAALEGRVSEARATLAAALQVEGPVVLTDDPAAVRPVLPPLEQLLATARQRRPELERAREEAEAQRHQVGVVRGELWPHLSLFGRAEARNEAFGVPQPNLIGHYTAGVQVSWRLFDSLETFAEARSAEIERQRLTLERDRLGHLVEAEVRSAHGRLKSALGRQAPLAAAQKLAETTLDLLRRRYQSGGALLFEVLAAEEELERLEAQAIESTIAVAEAGAALEAAVGS